MSLEDCVWHREAHPEVDYDPGPQDEEDEPEFGKKSRERRFLHLCLPLRWEPFAAQVALAGSRHFQFPFASLNANILLVRLVRTVKTSLFEFDFFLLQPPGVCYVLLFLAYSKRF